MDQADRNLNEVQRLARGLDEDRRDLGQSRDELTESLAELQREPTATGELSEGELVDLCKGFVPESAFDKFEQALRIETGLGGRFWKP